MPDNLKLFDEIERESKGPFGRSEPRWKSLNLSAYPGFEYIREVLQSWFDDYEASSNKRVTLRRNFRSDKSAVHLSAFFELYVYQLFKKQGFKIEVEPEWSNTRRPDFLLTSSDGQKILLEVTAIYPAFTLQKRLEGEVLDYLNQNLESPDFFLHIDIPHAPNNTPPYARICRFVQNWLDELNYDEVVQGELDTYPRRQWTHDTWTIEFRVFPKKGARGKSGIFPIGSIFHGVFSSGLASNIRSGIKRKTGRYGKIEIPYILAINVVDWVNFSEYALEYALFEALFGQEIGRWNSETDDISYSRNPRQALWLKSREFQNTRMSGLCIFNSLLPERIHRVGPIMWHHPGAEFPLVPGIFSLTQQLPDRLKGSYDLSKGKPPHELLQIDPALMPER